MKVGRIIHQQVMQLRWHFLACLGLIMILPLEEAIVNLKDGYGFYATSMAAISMLMSPLLAGLIACANVQADLDEKRDIFWRSKPVSIKSFLMIKFVIGLAVALLILACPILFAVISNRIYMPYDNLKTVIPVFFNLSMISMMAYSLCFLSTVLIRKTARGWLTGMAIAILLLLAPFILPLHFKDITTEFLAVISTAYILISMVTFFAAFILSLLAAAYNLHLQTNLKGLLWTTTAVLFGLILLFSRQVANIKVLDEFSEVPD